MVVIAYAERGSEKMKSQFMLGEEVIVFNYLLVVDSKMLQEKPSKGWFYLMKHPNGDPFVRAWLHESVLLEEHCINLESISYVEAMLAEQYKYEVIWFQNGSEQ